MPEEKATKESCNLEHLLYMSVQSTVNIVTTMHIFFPDVMLLYMYCLNVLRVSLSWNMWAVIIMFQ